MAENVIKPQALITIKTKNLIFETTVLLTPNLIYDVIIGTDSLANLNMNINFTKNTLTCSLSVFQETYSMLTLNINS